MQNINHVVSIGNTYPTKNGTVRVSDIYFATGGVKRVRFEQTDGTGHGDQAFRDFCTQAQLDERCTS